MSVLDALLARTKIRGRRRQKSDEGAGEAVLAVYAGDAGWSAELTGRAGSHWKRQKISVPEGGAASPPEQLADAMASLCAEQPQANIKSIVLLVDDADIQLVDHRFAKLTNFEPRAIKEFGAQQAGGRPIAFGSLPFGASSAREIEKRVLAFLPEDKLESYFFGLGKFATALSAVIPAGAIALNPQWHEGGTFATLRVNGRFSTLLVANGDAGIIAARHLSFGALALAKAYACEYGLGLEESSAALRMRARLPAVACVKDRAAPEHRTATFAALSPLLRQLHDDIAATLDYFRYQRLAGRPAHVGLTFTAPAIAGLDSWLGEALDLQVDLVADALPHAAEGPETHTLNLLEGSRSGLLKLGNQPYEFSHGRFLPIKGAQSEMPSAKSGSGSHLSLPWLEKLLARAAGREFQLRRDLVGQLLCGVVLAGLLVVANVYFLTSPAEQRLSDGASSYGVAAGSSVTMVSTGNPAASAAGDRTILWADDLLAIGKALEPGTKLERLELVPAGGKAAGGANASLAITGALSPGGANLKSVARFIDRLSQDGSFMQRFGQVRFTGASASQDETHHEMLFHVAALSASAKK